MKIAQYYDIETTQFARKCIRQNFRYINVWKRKGHLIRRYQALTKHFWFDFVYACVVCLLHAILIVRFLIHSIQNEIQNQFDTITIPILFVLFALFPIAGFTVYIVVPLKNLQSLLTNIHPLLYESIQQKYLQLPLAIVERNPKQWIQQNLFDHDNAYFKVVQFQLFCSINCFLREICDQCGYKYVPDVVLGLILHYSKYSDNELLV